MTQQKPSLPFIFYSKYGRVIFPVSALLTIILFNQSPEYLSPTTQIITLGVVIFLLGLPHGALDPWIAKRLGLYDSTKQKFLFNIGYLALTVLVVLFWLWLPALSLFVFLTISAWHFSGDWDTSINRPIGLCAGMLLLLMPIGFHTETVSTIFLALSGTNGAALATTLSLPPWFLAAAMILIAATAAVKRQWQTSLDFLALIGLAYFTPPLIYFTLYFCLLHSPRHLLGLLITAPVDTHPQLLRMMVIYTLSSLVLIGGLWWLWSALPSSTLILKLIFISLAAVTVPHMLLIFAVQSNKNST
jgi:Brp/Blh family beta-carotene 15,15'-monooxygenase